MKRNSLDNLNKGSHESCRLILRQTWIGPF